MCGIAGLWSQVLPKQERTELVGKMLAGLAHRGPDDEGVWSDDQITLGHRRLAVIDVAGGHQPMLSATNRSVVTFGGEIYNFKELRLRAADAGYPFHSAGDTEAILAAYETCGREFVSELHGMFAFGLWDRHERILWLARDRLGKKPLFVAQRGDTLAFASELGALKVLPWFDRRVSAAGLDGFFAYKAIPAPHTIYLGARKVRPGEVWRVGTDGTRATRYWSALERFASPASTPLTSELVEGVSAAVRMRLESEVPLGAFLSGGLDSGLVVSLMAQSSRRRVQAFSVGFDDPQFDELAPARLAARKTGAEHFEFVLRPNLVDALLKVAPHFGEPFGDSSAVPLYLLARETRRHVTVALSGDGGDELFAGYDRYLAMRYLDQFSPVTTRAPRLVAQTLMTGLSRFDAHRPFRRLGRLAAVVGVDMPTAYLRLLQTFASSERHRLTAVGSEVSAATDATVTSVFNEVLGAGGDVVNAAIVADYEVNVPTVLLPKLDIATMAASVEARAPLLDAKLTEMWLRIPGAAKLANRQTKGLARRLFAGHLSDHARFGPKRGFDIPVDRWLRGPLQELLRDSLASEKFRQSGFVSLPAVDRLAGDHMTGRRSNGRQLWLLLTLALWCSGE